MSSTNTMPGLDSDKQQKNTKASKMITFVKARTFRC